MKVLVSVSFVKAVFDSVWKEIRDLFGLALRRPSAIKKSQNKKQSKIGKKKKKKMELFSRPLRYKPNTNYMLVPHLFFRFSQSVPFIGVQQFLAPSDILF